MKTFVVAKRVIKGIVNDKRSLGLLFIAPILVLFLLKVILNSGAAKPDIDVISGNKTFISALKENAKVKEVKSKNIALKDLKDGKRDGYVEFNGKKVNIKIEGTNPSIANMTLQTINKALIAQNLSNMGDIINKLSNTINKLNANPRIVNGPNLSNSKHYAPLKAISQPQKYDLHYNKTVTNIKYLYGSKDATLFDSIAPLMMGFIIFFFVFLMAGVSFLRERISGTLERILSTPLKRIEIVMGYFFGFGLFVTLQTIIIQWFIIYALKAPAKGNFISILIINILLAAGSLSLGTLLSAFAANEFQLFQFIPLIIVPQILFCGIFDLREAPGWVTALSKIFPLTYGADALKNVMIRGKSIETVLIDLVILAAYAILFIVLNSIALKKYRRI